MSAASMIATHMNAPYGKIVSAQDVAASLQNGRLSAASKDANAILEALFTEVPASLILQCAHQVHAHLAKVNQLYQQTLDLGLMHSQEWEDAIGALA